MGQMDDPLVTYLHDHLAGANFAVELLENLQKRYPDQETGAFARTILQEVQADRRVLEDIIQRVGTGHFDVKNVMAWLAEKASRVKLGHSQPDDFATFETLEMLSLGIMGKLSLWRTLSVIGTSDERLAGIDLPSLSQRAQDQYDRVEAYGLSIARTAFQKESE
jgi:hypothetical protein